MPPRAAPADRLRVEATLPDALRHALAMMCEDFDVRDWRKTPLGPPFVCAAVLHRTAALMADGTGRTAALNEACRYLNVRVDTVQAWCKRWPVWSRHNAPNARTPTAVSLAQDIARHIAKEAA